MNSKAGQLTSPFRNLPIGICQASCFKMIQIMIINKQEFIIHNSVTQPVQYSLSTMPAMSTIHDKSGAGWNRIDTDDYFKHYFKTNEMGDVVQQEKKLQHHNSWKRITFN